MNMPAPRRRSMERWRGWPRDFWDPLGEFPQLWNRMAQMFESGEGGPDTWMPTVETEDTSDAYEVRAELPGMKSDDVNVELRGNELRITGEVTEKEGGGEGKPLRQRQGKFAYRTTVPADADAAKVDAELADGILTVRLPKAPQAQARQIQVKG